MNPDHRLDEASAVTSADAASAWPTLTDVGSWPRWTASITAIESLDGDGSVRVGARFLVRQPHTPNLVWRVTEVTEGAAFTWGTTTVGLRLVARHWITTRPDGMSEVHNSIEYGGPLAGLSQAISGRRTSMYLRMEIAGFAKASQGSSSAA